MKRYLMFAGYNYYPSGGWSDFKDSFDTLDEAKERFESLKNGMDGYGYDWCHVVDTQEIVDGQPDCIDIQ